MLITSATFTGNTASSVSACLQRVWGVAAAPSLASRASITAQTDPAVPGHGAWHGAVASPVCMRGRGCSRAHA